jgi:hypothetical protein
VEVLKVPWHHLYVPEEVADLLVNNQADVLTNAHHIARGGYRWWIDLTEDNREDANALAMLGLVGADDFHREWKLTDPGEDVREVLLRHPS